MAAKPSIKVVKTFSYRQELKRFSNRYHFNGGTPSDASHWHTLMDNVVAAEKAIFPSTVTIVECFGYAAGSDMPVASKTYSTAGTCSPAGVWKQAPGDVCVLLRWSTAARTSKNHPVYLFNYYHAALVDYNAADEQDIPIPGQASAVDTYAGSWISGFSDGTLTLVRAGPNGASATGHQVEDYVTHRDFPR